MTPPNPDDPAPTRTPSPPVAKRIPRTAEIHGEHRTDDYAWLRDKSNPEVKAHLDAENAYTTAVLASLEPLRERLYGEMLDRLKQTDQGVPWRKGGWLYYSRTVEGRQYPIHCRRPDRPDAREEVTLDLNELGREESFLALGAYEVSDDGRRLAYSTDTTGFREYTLFVKDLVTGELLEKVAERTGTVAWAADSRTLFYTVEEEATKRQHRLYRHAVDTPGHVVVYEEKDPAFNVGVERTRSGEYLLLEIESLTTSEAWFLAAGKPGDSLAYEGDPQ